MLTTDQNNSKFKKPFFIIIIHIAIPQVAIIKKVVETKKKMNRFSC